MITSEIVCFYQKKRSHQKVSVISCKKLKITNFSLKNQKKGDFTSSDISVFIDNK